MAADAESEAASLRADIADLRAQLGAMRSEMAALKKRVADLEQQVASKGAMPLPLTGTQPGTTATPPTPPPTSPKPADTVTVYRTASGSKFHRAGCSYLRGGGIPLSRTDAVAQGLGPCSRCNP